MELIQHLNGFGFVFSFLIYYEKFYNYVNIILMDESIIQYIKTNQQMHFHNII